MKKRRSDSKKVTRFVLKHRRAFEHVFTPCTRAYLCCLQSFEDVCDTLQGFDREAADRLRSATRLSRKQQMRVLAQMAVIEMMLDPNYSVHRSKIKHKFTFCRGCQALMSSQGGGENQEMHIGGCIPESQEFASACYKRETSQSPSLK